MRRDAALNAVRMLARSLWLHLDLWWNFVCNRTIFIRFLEIRLSLVPAQTLSYKNRNQTSPLEMNTITNSRSPYSENRCIVYCLKYQDFPDFYTTRFRISGSNLKSVLSIIRISNSDLEDGSTHHTWISSPRAEHLQGSNSSSSAGQLVSDRHPDDIKTTRARISAICIATCQTCLGQLNKIQIENRRWYQV